MKKLIVLAIAAISVFGAVAQERAGSSTQRTVQTKARNHKEDSNLIDKIPSGYVGTVGFEFYTPGAYKSSMFGATTVHGYMFSSRAFIGAGVGYLRDFDAEKYVIPVFAEGRYYFPSMFMRKIYPHIGLRLGGQIGEEGGTGFYGTLAAGVRVPLSEKLALNLEVGPQYSGKYEQTGNSDVTLGVGTPWESRGSHFAFFARLMLEF